MVQLARGRQYAALGGSKCPHNAIRIPVRVVRQRGNAAECIHSGRSIAASSEAKEKGMFLYILDVWLRLTWLGCCISTAALRGTLFWWARRSYGEKTD